MTPAETAYQRALLHARDRGYTLSRAALESVEAAFRAAAADLARDAARRPGTVTAERAEALRRQVVAILGEIERELARTTATANQRIVYDLTAIHRRAAVTIAERFAAGVDTGALAGRFDVVPTRALAALASRGGTARHFRTLIRRHMVDAAPALDRILAAGVARGQSTASLTRDVATLLAGGERPPAVRAAGLRDADVSGLRSVRYDAARIARSETLNALREGGRAAMLANPMVRATAWQLSGAHVPQGCACEILASVDWYGFGPGFFPPEAWPLTGHPFCACVQGSVILRPPAEWQQPPAAAPAARYTAETAPLPAEAAEWSPARVQRLRAQLAQALSGGGPASARGAA